MGVGGEGGGRVSWGRGGRRPAQRCGREHDQLVVDDACLRRYSLDLPAESLSIFLSPGHDRLGVFFYLRIEVFGLAKAPDWGVRLVEVETLDLAKAAKDEP